tara:strand:+ start:156 stop:332 length:177 start_codon:yes stop_codon:yes gene_type:complete
MRCLNKKCTNGKDGKQQTIRSPRSKNWTEHQLCFKCFLEKFPAYKVNEIPIAPNNNAK